MRFNLTPASYRVLERASRLRLQRGIAAISFVKLLSALFEEEECRAAHWLRESGLSLEQFQSAFGIQMLQSPVSAPPFPMGTYGITPGQYAPPTPKSSDIEASKTDNNAPSVGNSYSAPLPSDESEHEHPHESDEETQDILEQTEPPKYSIYTQQRGQKLPGQNRLQFYFDDQRITAWLFLPELEDCLEMVAMRFTRQDHRHSISIAGGIKQIALGAPALPLLTEHLLLAAVLDTGNVGNWLRDNGFEPTELYQRIDVADNESRERNEVERPDLSKVPNEPGVPTESFAVCRLLDAAANRGREAIRVLEDYVRFLLDDAELTQRLKTFRHQFQNVLQQFPMEQRLAARNTEYDVGTDISAEGEYERPTVDDILSANFSRLQESLRSLEEFSKMFDSQAARQFEQLRYQCYTLHKDVVANHLADTPAEERTLFD